MKTLEYKTHKDQIKVYVDGKLWQIWERNDATEAIANGYISPPSDLNEARENL